MFCSKASIQLANGTFYYGCVNPCEKYLTFSKQKYDNKTSIVNTFSNRRTNDGEKVQRI